MVNFRVFHTADVHLGLKFGSYPESISKTLCEARFKTLEQMVLTANSEKCDLFTIGGDLFDNLRVARKDVVRTAQILSQFDRLVLIIPGNHDYLTGQEDDLWKTLKEGNPDRLIVCTEQRPYSLKSYDLDVIVYPAPCQNKHSKTHAMGWISHEKKDPEQFHLGMAHGSYEGLTPDLEGDYYPMTQSELLQCHLDLWLMGHIHIQFPQTVGSSDRVFYPSTPEPDGFDCKHEGKAWIFEISDNKTIHSRSVSTGRHRFLHDSRKIQNLQDLQNLHTLYSSPEYRNMLLKLNLTGALEHTDFQDIPKFLEELKQCFLYLQADYSQVSIRLTPERIDQEFPRESFPHRLLTDLSKKEEDRDALQLAYELMREISRK